LKDSSSEPIQFIRNVSYIVGKTFIVTKEMQNLGRRYEKRNKKYHKVGKNQSKLAIGDDSHVIEQYEEHDEEDHEIHHVDLVATGADLSNFVSHDNVFGNAHEPEAFEDDKGICWMHMPDEPFGPRFFLSSRGQSTVHIYLWIAKDLTWVQGWYYPGLCIGGLAVALSTWFVLKSAFKRDINETWPHITEMLWLFANYWWMIGELYDYEYPDRKSIYNKHTHEAGCVMISALSWATLYYLILKPLGWTKSKQDSQSKNDLFIRFPAYFKSWDEYENVHSLLWSGKDTAWVWSVQPMWLVFFFPALFVSLDFAWLSLHRKDMLIEHAHYVAQLLWMCANAVWAAGEFFLSPNHDEPLNMDRWNSEARVTSRWYSSWVVVLSFLPLVMLYCIWIPATIMGRIQPSARSDETTSSSPSSGIELAPTAMQIGSGMTTTSPFHVQSFDPVADSSTVAESVDGSTVHVHDENEFAQEQIEVEEQMEVV
jgi:hypothetical protein